MGLFEWRRLEKYWSRPVRESEASTANIAETFRQNHAPNWNPVACTRGSELPMKAPVWHCSSELLVLARCPVTTQVPLFSLMTKTSTLNACQP